MITTVVPGTVWSELALDRSICCCTCSIWMTKRGSSSTSSDLRAPLMEIFE
jgi:multisubunit Na+/H+ antiporter MnhE subunit